jgi:hypothetical protein
VLSNYTTSQKACAAVLAEILDRAAAYEWATNRDVPNPVWTIGYSGMNATIDEVTLGDSSSTPFVGLTLRQAFDWWVEILKAERVADRMQSDGRRFLSAQLRTNGIVVVLRTYLPADEVVTEVGQ